MEKGDSDTFPPGRSELMHPVTTADVSVQKRLFRSNFNSPSVQKSKAKRKQGSHGSSAYFRKAKAFSRGGLFLHESAWEGSQPRGANGVRAK